MAPTADRIAESEAYTQLMVRMDEALRDWQAQRSDLGTVTEEVESIMKDIKDIGQVDMTIAQPMLDARGLGVERRQGLKRLYSELLAAGGRGRAPAAAPGASDEKTVVGGSLLVPSVTLVLIGPPGEGKSTLGNLLSRGITAGAPGPVPFKPADSFDSCAAEAAHEDFEYGGVSHRVVDTTGLLEGLAGTADQLHNFGNLTPGGIDAFVFVVRKGRFTDEILQQLSAFEDAAGKGALKRTVVVFTYCARETSEELVRRCRQSGNANLRQALSRTASVVGIDAALMSRAEEDRRAVLAATGAVCRAHRGEPRLRSMEPAAVRRELAEMDSTIHGLSGERQQAMRMKVENLRSGCASLEAVRLALAESRTYQGEEERGRQEKASFSGDLLQAEMEGTAAKSVVEREAARQAKGSRSMLAGGPFACCQPQSEGTCCAMPCDDGAKQLVESWYIDRQTEIHSKFAEADARAENSHRGQMRGATAH